jgi:hypothetical protein
LDSLGPIKPGFTLAEIEEICTQVEYAWLFIEGLPTPVVITKLGEMTVLFEMSDTVPTSWIYRASTSSHLARTQDGVGPGIDLATVSKIWPDLKIVYGEGTFALSEEHPGISLEIGTRSDRDWRVVGEAQRTGNLGLLPEGTFVAGVLLTGLSHRRDW